MGLIIECPYYISDKRRTISCEGCIRCFADTEEKKGQLVNVCEKNYKKCKYYSGLQKVYESCNDSSLEMQLRLKDYYLEENRKTIKKLIQRIGIMETNIAHNIETKQREVDKLRQELKISSAREFTALSELAAVMYANGIEIVDFNDVEKFLKTHTASFEDVDLEGRTARLVVKELERGQE
ncbi:hypothetical protein [Senimuribacter intestinalis]|uniref:hypothetical protein n=1 Tax=Senimuribacter intestinalis TaxID=2941507 RepID=UPI00203B19E1|nr:hypothetical protein [Senimuribacter intestinalis]